MFSIDCMSGESIDPDSFTWVALMLKFRLEPHFGNVPLARLYFTTLLLLLRRAVVDLEVITATTAAVQTQLEVIWRETTEKGWLRGRSIGRTRRNASWGTLIIVIKVLGAAESMELLYLIGFALSFLFAFPCRCMVRVCRKFDGVKFVPMLTK